MEKQCAKCGGVKIYDLFHRNSRSKDGLCSYCKQCAKATLDVWKVKNPDKRKVNQKKFYDNHKIEISAARKNRIVKNVPKSKLQQSKYAMSAKYKRYGLTVDSFEQKLIEQKGKCALCSIEFDSSKKPQIDHDHKTGRTRDLLCSICNMKLGHFENKEFIRIAIGYIEKHRRLAEASDKEPMR